MWLRYSTIRQLTWQRNYNTQVGGRAGGWLAGWLGGGWNAELLIGGMHWRQDRLALKRIHCH